MVISASWVRARPRISSRSSGLAKRASATVGVRPRGGQRLGGLLHLGQPGAEGQQRHARAFADHPALADFQRHALGGHLDPHAFAARIAKGDGAVVMRGGGGDHVDQFRLIRGGHHHDAGQVGKEGHVEGPGMGGAIGPHQPGAVDGKAHRQALDRHVMHDLIVAALQEGGIDRAEGLHPARRKPRRKGDGVLFGNADVEGALGKALGEQVQPGAIGHGGGDGDDLVVGLGLADQGSARRPWCSWARSTRPFAARRSARRTCPWHGPCRAAVSAGA